MRTHKRVTLILALTTTMLLPAMAQESGTNKRPLSNTRLASCLVKITADPGVIPLNPGTVESLLYTSNVGLMAARDVLDIETPDNIRDLIEVQWLDASPVGAVSPEDMSQAYDQDMMAEYEKIYGQEYLEPMGLAPDEKRQTDQGGRTARAPRRDIRVTRGSDRAREPRIGPDGVQTVTLQLVVHLPEDVRPAAREFMTEITDRLRVTLIDAHRDQEEELRMLLDAVKARWDDAARKLETTLAQPSEARNKPGVEVDVKSLSDYHNVLEDKTRQLELNLRGMQARQDAIQRQIAETRKLAETQLAQDAIARELMNLLKINENNLATLHKQVDAGRASPADLAQANENMARARIELAKRQEELARQAGGGQLENLNKEMSTIAIETAQKQAEMELLTRQLQETQQQLARATAFDPQAARIRTARGTMSILERRIAELQIRLANLQPPTVMVIGAN